MKKRKVLFWDNSVSDMLKGRQFGGIAVQLNFWMEVFIKKNWDVHALTLDESFEENERKFHKVQYHKKFDLLLDWIKIFRIIWKINPDIIITRGARRQLLPLATITNLFGKKLIMFGASDNNFIKGASTLGNRINLLFYEYGIRLTETIITQTTLQYNTLLKNYNKISLIIPNIWINSNDPQKNFPKTNDVIWISNFRRLKRAEWVIECSRNLSQYNFIIAGGPIEKDYYDTIKFASKSIKNITFLGQIPISKSNELIQSSKVLICTSKFEGFPNTFLQAWSYSIPVISSVDPNGVIEKNNLGIIVKNTNQLEAAIKLLLSDEDLYVKLQTSIQEYFNNNHSVNVNYDKLISYLDNKT